MILDVRFIGLVEVFDYLTLLVLRVVDWRGVIFGCHVNAGWEEVVVVVDVGVNE